MIKIEKGVPLRPSGSGAHCKYPFREMEVGDSFLAPLKARNNMTNLAKTKGVKVTTRREGDQIRVWRVA